MSRLTHRFMNINSRIRSVYHHQYHAEHCSSKDTVSINWQRSVTSPAALSSFLLVTWYTPLSSIHILRWKLWILAISKLAIINVDVGDDGSIHTSSCSYSFCRHLKYKVHEQNKKALLNLSQGQKVQVRRILLRCELLGLWSNPVKHVVYLAKFFKRKNAKKWVEAVSLRHTA